MKITIFGTGYVGLVTGVCLANLGHEVLCADINEKKIKKLDEGVIPFYEPRLKELVTKNIEKNKLSFTYNPQKAVEFGEAIFNCVGTPSNKDGSANLEYIFNVAKTVSKFSKEYKILINKSTVPPGTARKCQSLIFEIDNESKVEIVSNPEFLKEGSAIYDFMHPDKIVIGAKTERAKSLVRKIYTGRVRSYIPFVETEWETAEMIKYANNSFLATKISFINELANICDINGADIKIISQAMGLDYRISPKFLNPGVGYGGSCFPKDVRALVNASSKKGYEAKLLKEVDLLNERQKKIFINKIIERFGSDLNKKIFSVWGLSFKPKTSDIRESTSLVLIGELIKLGAKINVYDPIAMNDVFLEIGSVVTYCQSISETLIGSSAIILCTEWDEFRNVNFSEFNSMNEKVIFDGRNIYEPEFVKEEGFEYYGVGRK